MLYTGRVFEEMMTLMRDSTRMGNTRKHECMHRLKIRKHKK